MNLLPRRRFTISSRLQPETAQARLRDAIGPAAEMLARTDQRPFMGSMSGASFSVTRVSRGRNSFRPLILGSIEAGPGGSRVTGTMRLHSVVLVFMCFLMAVPAWLFVYMLWHSLTTGRWDTTILMIPAGALLLVAMMMFGFVIESRRAFDDLAALVEGENA